MKNINHLIAEIMTPKEPTIYRTNRIAIQRMTPKESNVYNNMIAYPPYDSYGVAHGYVHDNFYKHAIPSGLTSQCRYKPCNSKTPPKNAI
jgi:hypothetical protein